MTLESSLSFPYRVGGRVVGALEVINPKKSGITVDDQKLFSNLCSCLMATVQ
jgi:hypothetical protein